MTRRNSPAIAAIVAEGFLSRLAFGVANLTLPLYLHSIGMSIAAIAALSVVNSAVAVLLKPVMGRVADRRGLKLSLSTAIALRSAMSLMYAVVAVPWQLFGLRAGHGVADSLRDPAINALIAEHGGRKAVASSFAWYQTAKTFAGWSARGRPESPSASRRTITAWSSRSRPRSPRCRSSWSPPTCASRGAAPPTTRSCRNPCHSSGHPAQCASPC
jgi:hypothetical protein